MKRDNLLYLQVQIISKHDEHECFSRSLRHESRLLSIQACEINERNTHLTYHFRNVVKQDKLSGACDTGKRKKYSAYLTFN